MTLSIEIIVIGALTGLGYAVLAAGLVLIYRATGVINFAHGQTGALMAAVLARLVLEYGWNYFVALALMLAGGALLGGLIELGIVRRLFKAPRVVLLVATIGVAQLLLAMEAFLPDIAQQSRYPSPLDRTLELGNLLLRSEHFMVIALIPAVIVGLSLFMDRTPYGLAIRASAENTDVATLAGISPKRVSTIVWMIAGALATLSAVLISPLRPALLGLPSAALGPNLLLRALTAALVGRLVSLPSALGAGVVIGILEAIVFVNISNPGVVDALLFIAVLLLLYLRVRSQQADEGTWSLSAAVRPVPERLLGLWWVRRAPQLLGFIGLVVAILIPIVFRSSGDQFLSARVLIYAMIALSVTVLTGWSGQLSLGQFAFVGLGALTTSALVGRGMPFGPAVAYATVAGVGVAFMMGFPALRVRGPFLAVATLGFAVAARQWLFGTGLFLEGRGSVPRGTFLGIDFQSERSYYYFCLVVFVGAVLAVAQLRRSGIGRSIIAIRDNEAAASSFGVPPAITKLTAFGVAGGLAALAGALLAGLQVQFSFELFSPEASLAAVSMTIIGGLGSIGGSILGAMYIVGLPALLGFGGTIEILTSGVGLLLLLLYMPGGLVQVAYAARDAALGWADRRYGATAPPSRPAVAVVEHLATQRAPDVDGTPLRADAITVRFGGLVALTNVSVGVEQGEVIGLIGSNGAGKSTLMNVISGFITPEAGTVELFGRDATELPPHARARLGAGRVFQDAHLFPDLTIREAIQVSLETTERSELVPSMLALPPSRRAERSKASEAAEYISFLGLGRYADMLISELSTGTRRIVEMACLLAQRARLLLLDEPTAGVAQRETEAFGPLLRRIKEELGASILIIEHDMPLVMSISDRIYALSAGECVAEGRPNEVRRNAKVIASYLGTDERAIQRSGSLTEALDPGLGSQKGSPGRRTRRKLKTKAKVRGRR